MRPIQEKDIEFQFPNYYEALKYDDEKGFYKTNIEKIKEESAVDILALNTKTDLLFVIEIKDYIKDVADELGNGSKVQDVISKICRKILDTLGGLYAAYRADDSSLEPFYNHCLGTKEDKKISIVLYLIAGNDKNKILNVNKIYKAVQNKISFFNFENIDLVYSLELKNNYDWKIIRNTK